MSTHKAVPRDGAPGSPVMGHKAIALFVGVLMLLLVLPLTSCSTPAGQKGPADAAKTGSGEKVRQADPAPGDVRLVNGIEYIYGRNSKFGISPDEPEYVWISRENYSPGRNGGLTSKPDPAWENERKALLERLEKLEAEVKKSGQ